MTRGLASALREAKRRTGTKAAVIVPLVVYFLALSGFLADSYSRFDFPLDDAWIHRVYSRSVAFGHGFEYNEGVAEAGSTSPLWAIVTAPAHWLEGAGGGAVPAAVKLIGVLIGLAAVVAVNRLTRRMTGSVLAGCVAASLFALEPRFLFSCLSGMENVLLVALWVGGSAALLAGRPFVSVVLFALAPVTRPEAVVLLPLCLPGLIHFARTRGRRLAAVGAWVIPFVPLAVWAAFCKAATGHFLPNTYYLKTHPFHLGLRELDVAWRSVFLEGLAPWWAFAPGVAACVAACRTSPRWSISLAALLAAPCVYLLGVVGTRSVFLQGYYWTRWLDPACIVLAVPFCAGFGAVIAAGFSRRRTFAMIKGLWPDHPTRAGVLAGVLGIVCLVAAVPSYRKAVADRRGHLSSDSRAIHILNVQAGQWIAEHTPTTSVVAVNDAGAIRYFGKRKTIDLMGLNNAELAFRRIDVRHAVAGADWIAIFPAWFSGTPVGADMEANFEPRLRIRIPVAEYTICRDPGQTVVAIMERKRPTPPAPDGP